MPVPAVVSDYVYLDHIKALQATVGKPIIFPSGFIEFVERDHLKMVWKSGEWSDRKYSIRKYLDETGEELGLNWHYDVGHDAVAIDFPWHKTGSRTGRDLVAAVIGNAPAPGEEIPFGKDTKPDLWTPAFDELLSQPENFPEAWKTQVVAACTERAAGLGFICDNLFVNTLKDGTGRSHLLVLACSMPLAIPGPAPRVAFYLFDSDGKWEDGGTFEAGNCYYWPTFKLEPKKDCMTVETVRDNGRFGLPVKDATRYDLRLTIKTGKVKADLWKNDVPAIPADYSDARFSPLARYK